MKKKNILIIILCPIAVLAVLMTGFVLGSMHKNEGQGAAARKILYYRNAMNPQITSPVPKKDEMGMDYAPVYAVPAGRQEEEGQGAGIPGAAQLSINPQQQQLLGIQTEKIQKRPLTKQILTVGMVAYDPDLYVAQEEYLQALKTANNTQNSVLTSVSAQSKALLEAAQKKLLLLGMSKEEIDALAKAGKPQENLYLPGAADKVWAYMPIYEYEIGFIKEGMPVEIESVAFPGEVFQGKIIAITPVLDASTRSAQIRTEIDNPQAKLKPQMYVNGKIEAGLGEKLAVPEDAVMDTGERQLVFVAKGEGNFEQSEVKLGEKAKGYYEVLSGLEEGEEVVSSGNFFVDSESRLKTPVNSGIQHQHK